MQNFSEIQRAVFEIVSFGTLFRWVAKRTNCHQGPLPLLAQIEQKKKISNHLDNGVRDVQVRARIVESLAIARLRTMGVALASGKMIWTHFAFAFYRPVCARADGSALRRHGYGFSRQE